MLRCPVLGCKSACPVHPLPAVEQPAKAPGSPGEPFRPKRSRTPPRPQGDQQSPRGDNPGRASFTQAFTYPRPFMRPSGSRFRERCIGSDEAAGVFAGLASAIGIGLPRRLASSVATRSNQSNCWSSRYRMAFGKSLGRAVLREGWPGRASGGLLDGESSNLPVEKRSGVWFLIGSRPMPRILPPSES